ncbi:MAG TPA: anti-sigma factor [Jatrophihabitans sp.]
MTSPDLHSLVGAYAVDALNSDERIAFEDHLNVCADCANEVGSLQAAATELSHIAAIAPPPELRASVLASISQVRPLPPVVDNVIALRRARAGRSVWQGLAAACALIAILVGAWGYQQHRDAGRTSASPYSQFNAVLSAPDARTISHSLGTGNATVVYSRSTGKVAMVAHGISAPGANKVYQLWMLASGKPAASGGTFTPDANGEVRIAAQGDVKDTASMGVSIEPAGGSPQPTHIVGIMPL